MCSAWKGNSQLYRVDMGNFVNNKGVYRHGGTPGFDLHRLNLREKPVPDFSVNVNPLGAPLTVKKKWAELASAVENYPSMHGHGVASYYEHTCNLPPQNVLAACSHRNGLLSMRLLYSF
jgi:histidinol-phosphate/aromatic aminotransferase/cobyric acid decarboxylase-like protein